MDLKRLKSLALAATKGPWKTFTGNTTSAVEALDAKGRKVDVVAWKGFDGTGLSLAQCKRNAAFIAEANPATVLRLIQAVELEGRPDIPQTFHTAIGKCHLVALNYEPLKDAWVVTYWYWREGKQRRQYSAEEASMVRYEIDLWRKLMEEKQNR